MSRLKSIFLLISAFISTSCSFWNQLTEKTSIEPPKEQQPISFNPIVLGDTICQFNLHPDHPKLAMFVPINLPKPPDGFVWKIQLMTALNARNDSTILCEFSDSSLKSLKIDQPAPLTDPNNPEGSKQTLDSFTQSSPAPINTEAQLTLTARFIDTHFRQRISIIAIPVNRQ